MENHMSRLLLIFGSAALLSLSAYRLGYTKATERARIEYFEGVEGYCLADTPAHPGECKGGPNG